MKKLLLLTALIWGYASTVNHAYAPSYKKRSVRNAPIKKLKFGVAAGPAMLITSATWRLRYPRIVKPEIKLGRRPYSFHTNIYGSYQLIDNLRVRLDLSYIRKGHQFTGTYTFEDQNIPKVEFKAAVKVDYIQARATLYLYPQKDSGFFCMAGGYVAYLLSANDQVYVYQEKEEIMHESGLLTKDNDTMKSYDAGITAGLGYEWEIGLEFSLISDIGFVETFQFNKEIYLNTTIDLKAKNIIALYASVGYNFAKLLQ